MNLTEARIDALPLGAGIFRDEQAKGLMVIRHATTRSYAVQGDVRRHGRHVRTVRVKIDRCDRIGLREARRRAKELMSQILSGVDPTAKPRETAMTVAQALDAHLSDRELRPTTSASYREHLDRYLKTVRGRAVPPNRTLAIAASVAYAESALLLGHRLPDASGGNRRAGS